MDAMITVLKMSTSIVTIAYHDQLPNACNFYRTGGERMSILLDARCASGAQVCEPLRAEETGLGQEAIHLVAEGRPG